MKEPLSLTLLQHPLSWFTSGLCGYDVQAQLARALVEGTHCIKPSCVAEKDRTRADKAGYTGTGGGLVKDSTNKDLVFSFRTAWERTDPDGGTQISSGRMVLPGTKTISSGRLLWWV